MRQVAAGTASARNPVGAGWKMLGKRLNRGKRPLSWPDVVSPMSSHLGKRRRKNLYTCMYMPRREGDVAWFRLLRNTMGRGGG